MESRAGRASGSPPARAGEVGYGSLLTFSALTVVTVPDSAPLLLEFFPFGASKTILCYADTCWEVVAWWCFLELRAQPTSHSSTWGDCKNAGSGPTPDRVSIPGQVALHRLPPCFWWSDSHSVMNAGVKGRGR